MCAVIEGHEAVVSMLLRNKFVDHKIRNDVRSFVCNSVSMKLNIINSNIFELKNFQDGLSALMLAVKYNHRPIVSLLMKAINSTSDLSPLEKVRKR